MKRPITTVLLALVPLVVFSQQDQEDTEQAAELDTIVVTATRTERNAADVPATVSLLTAEDIETIIARDIRDLVRYEPGVSVSGTGDRYGLSGFTIRGISGNRVLTVVDGVRVADAFSFGPFLNARRDFIDVDSIKTFEIVRGPASALYGSDALGGVVAFRTKDARDYLNGEPVYGNFKAGYSSADDSSVGTVTLAAGSDRFSGLLVHSRRQSSETENFGEVGGTGETRELPDPIDSERQNTSIKLSFHPSEAHEFTFGADIFEDQTDTDVLSNYGNLVVSPFSSVETLSEMAFDTAERARVSLSYTYTPVSNIFDRLTAQIYTQESENVQLTRQDRRSLTSGTETFRERDSFFDQEIDGFSFQIDKQIQTDSTSHYLVFGGEHWTTNSIQRRAGGEFDPISGAPVPFTAILTRDFPPTETVQYGLFVQDEISLLDDRLLLTPSLRFDSFDADATGDDIFFDGNPGQAVPDDYSDSEVSPRLGMLYRLTDRYSLYAQYAEGFRAPPYDDVNIGFTNLTRGYTTISNPDLKSERSEAVEFGLRVDTGNGNIAVTAYQNDYDDFIQSQATIGFINGLLTFQSQNLDEVEIKGFEVSGGLDIGDNDYFGLNFAFATADSKDKTTNQPLNSIDPAKAVIGLSYDTPGGRWGGELVWTVVEGKSESDIDENEPPRYATSGYGLLDLLGYYRFTERVSLNFGLFNVGDTEYIDWADTNALDFDATSGTFPEVRRFTRPGFNAGFNLRIDF